MKLHLSSKNKMLGGVCAGIAETIGVDPSFVRIGFLSRDCFFIWRLSLYIYSYVGAAAKGITEEI